MPPHTHKPPPRATTRVCKTSIPFLSFPAAKPQQPSQREGVKGREWNG